MIAAIKRKDGVYLGYADDAGNLEFDDNPAAENVPCLIADDLIVMFERADAATDYLVNDEETFRGEINRDTILNVILPQIRDAADGYYCIENGSWNNAAIICKGDKLYSIDRDFYVKEETDYACFGYAPEYAESVFDAERVLPPREAMTKAFDFYARRASGCCRTHAFVDTREKRLKILNGGEWL